jgi:hypothetical protein
MLALLLFPVLHRCYKNRRCFLSIFDLFTMG